MKASIRKSKLHGKGIFTKRNIKKGETIFVVRGKKIKFLISDRKRAKIAGLNWIGWGKNIWIDPVDFGLYLNHSCKPNAIVKKRVNVVALHDIKKGEEITSDYSLNEADIFWRIKCNCGVKSCRGVVKPIQFLPRKIFNRYSSYMSKYYQQVFNKFEASNFKNPKELERSWVNFIKKGFSV